ncbi:MAG TPA: lactate utilization protein [Longimicrobiaceae bacterium]
MTRNEEARRSVLAAIRRRLAESAPHDAAHAQRHQPPTPADRGMSLPVLNGAAPSTSVAVEPLPRDPLERFRYRLEAVAGTFTLVRGSDALVAELERILRSAGARRVAVSEAAEIRAVVEGACERAGAELIIDASPRDLFDCDVGISTAQWAIAETGTLVLESRLERHRFVSLIPRVHIALLRADRVCETLGDALQRVRAGAAEGEVPSAAITLITGPSRTSDIELTLAIGVHGPQELHVVVVEPGDATMPDATANPTHSQPDGLT